MRHLIGALCHGTFALAVCSVAAAQPFPAVLPKEKPTDRPLSAAMQRLYDVWNPHEDRDNELYSNFKYSRLEGFSREPNVSRRDPSKVIRTGGTYYVWYTCRRSVCPPSSVVWMRSKASCSI